MRAMLLAVVVMGTGCVAGSFDRIEGQDEAERIVWDEIMGEAGCHPPPPVEWLPWERGDGWEYGGGTWIGWKVQVRIQPSGMPNRIAASSFSHELEHYRHWLHTGDVDPLHLRGEWERVLDAKSALAIAGL